MAGSLEFSREELNGSFIPDELTDAEKLEYIYQVALKVDAAVREVLPQVGPILESVSKNPMLKMFLR